MLDLDTEAVGTVVVDIIFCLFLNLITTHTIMMLTIRITAISPINDATMGKNILLSNAVS